MTLLAIVAAFFAAGIAGAVAARVLDLWELPCAGFAAALGVVGVAYLAAPTRKFPFAALCLVLGAAVAWHLIGEEWYPEHYDGLAYRSTLLPFASTLVGGLLALTAAAVAELIRRPTSEDPATSGPPRWHPKPPHLAPSGTTSVPPSMKITAETFAHFRQLDGDTDGLARAEPAKASAEESVWWVIADLRQRALIAAENLGSEQFGRNLEADLARLLADDRARAEFTALVESDR
ncbi:MAG: hypothetical protein U1E39_03965 [Planctomycetota bacterium]